MTKRVAELEAKVQEAERERAKERALNEEVMRQIEDMKEVKRVKEEQE